jgi:glycerophosphoryl diester phosphodiesterase
VTIFEIQGHRGARGSWSENTLPSIMAAIEAGVQAIEVDLLSTKDGEIIIHHHFFLNPKLCTYLDGSQIEESPLISELTFSEIKKIDCGAKLNPDFPSQKKIPGTTIPTLKELFSMLKNSHHPNARSVRLNLEIKADPANPKFILDYSSIVKNIIDLVKKYGFSERVYYSSFDSAILLEVRKVNPQATLGYVFDAETLAYANVNLEDWTSFIVKKAEDLHAKIISPDYVLLNETIIHDFRSKGFKVITWTVNDYEICKELIAKGVDGIITDYPEEFIRSLKHENLL